MGASRDELQRCCFHLGQASRSASRAEAELCTVCDTVVNIDRERMSKPEGKRTYNVNICVCGCIIRVSQRERERRSYAHSGRLTCGLPSPKTIPLPRSPSTLLISNRTSSTLSSSLTLLRPSIPKSLGCLLDPPLLLLDLCLSLTLTITPGVQRGHVLHLCITLRILLPYSLRVR